ncbi:MAG: hypothetical protein KatS3mg121_0001 [Gammaproteobacteria bacterium]|nr:MAG: hypothetical protein KatS3mg121_0001 [Gammaproteobacteria bacterium]
MDFDGLIRRGLEVERRSAADRPAPMLLDETLVVLHILAPEGGAFDGETLYAALAEAGFDRRRGELFVCAAEHGEYLALNALKPGRFPAEPAGFATRAVGLVLPLAGSERPLAAFEDFLERARGLSDALGGRLCDARRSSLTRQTIGYLREEVQQYQLKHLAAQRKGGR